MESKIEYSTDIAIISLPRFNDWCVHLLCLSGKCNMTYNSRRLEFGKNCAVVIEYPSLVSDIVTSNDFEVEIILAPNSFLRSQLPANHYGVGGSIALFDNPVIPLSDIDSSILHKDLLRVSERLSETDNPFYAELMSSLILTMVYDLFAFHAKVAGKESASIHTTNLVSRLMPMLQSGRVKTFRSVTYYASQLNVTPKYLSDTVRRQTGQSVTQLINRHTVPLLVDYMKNTDLSLSQIAEEFNFSSLSYLSRYIKKLLGTTPKEYRASLQPKKTD